ncbi:MAG TPA: HEAT repeat domain-containing protein [Candidatus Margulisiibacteriota bacterium]|nr:HEAT repeat domain-containing protein [Candidatus Margulisiibacteriota bacterium]
MEKRPLKVIAVLLSILLAIQQTGFAQVASVELNIAGHLASLQSAFSIDKFRPLHLRYISYDSLNNNFKLILDKGDIKNLYPQEVKSTAKDLLNYFLVGISLPNDSFWVNLRPDSPDNVIDPLVAKTEIGRILLESDLQLKKDTAQATSPETPEGKDYWHKLYQKAEELYGSDNVTIPTLTRPWIVPDEIIIGEGSDFAYVYKATLKVCLEQDYLKDHALYSFKDPREKALNEYSSQLIREKIIPRLTKEVNSAKRYAPLRQVYYSLILAQWFKARNANKNNQYSRLIDRKILTNLQAKTPYSADTYFNAYKENFEKGEYNIQEPVYTSSGQVVRTYLSGGISSLMQGQKLTAMLHEPIGSINGPLLISSSAEINNKNNLPILEVSRELNINTDGLNSIGSSPLKKEAVDVVASSPNTLEDKEARIFLKNKGVDVDRLERDFGDIIQTYGYIDFKRLYIATGDSRYLLGNVLPKLKQTFTPKKFKAYWPDIVRFGITIGDSNYLEYSFTGIQDLIVDKESLNAVGEDLIQLKAAVGKDAWYLFGPALAKLRQILTSEELKAYWPGLVRLGVAARRNAQYVFEYGIPALKETFTPEEFKLYWPDLVRLGVAAGENSRYLFQSSIPALNKVLIVDRESLNAIGDDLLRLGAAAGEAAGPLFDSILILKETFTSKELKSYWPDLVRLGVAAGKNACALFDDGLPTLNKVLIVDKKSLNAIGDDLIRLIAAADKNIEDLFEYGFPALMRVFTPEELRYRWPDLVRMGLAAGEDAGRLFEAIAGLPKEPQSYWPDLVRMGLAAGKDVLRLFHSILTFKGKPVFYFEDLKSYWPDLMRLGVAAGKNAWILFEYGFPVFREWIVDKESLNSVGNDIVRLVVAAGEAAEDLFRYTFPALKKYFTPEEFRYHWPEINNTLLDLLRNSNEYNREKLLDLLSDSYLAFIKEGKLDFFKVAKFYNDVVFKENRLALQILEGVLEGLKDGSIDKELPEAEQQNIFSFIKLTHSFNHVLYRLYKRGGEEAIGSVFTFARNINLDSIGEAELTQLKSYLQSLGVKESEMKLTILGCIQMAIPSSGASFVKRDQILGLLDKFLAAGDRRGDIPRELANKNFGDDTVIELTNYTLTPDQVFDPEGNISGIISSLRQRHEGLNEEQIKEAIAKDKRLFITALLEWFKDLSSQDKKKQALSAFYTLASHNDLLKEKIDAISSDYNALLLLDALFADKDNLSILVREVLDKDITYSDLPKTGEARPITDPSGLLKQILRIWNNPQLPTLREKTEVLQRMLSGYSQTELNDKVLPMIEDTSLREAIQGLSLSDQGGVSKERIIEALFSQPYNFIQQEKNKFTTIRWGEVALEFRVVKGIPYGLWGLNAGVCIATDLNLWKKKDFFLLAIIDKNSQKAVGFVHLFQKQLPDGSWILTVPGIEPSVEFLTQVKAEEIFPLIEKALIKIASAGNYQALYLPQDKNILSNRSDIQKIAQKKYSSRTAALEDKINWNTLPAPYSFNEVYVVWERGAETSSPLMNEVSQKFILTLLDLEDKLNAPDTSICIAAINALGPLYQAMVKERKVVSLSLLEDKIKAPGSAVRQAAINALGLIYLAMIKEGKEVSISLLESQLYTSDSDLRQAAINALGPLYQAMVENGKMSLSQLEDKLNDSYSTIHIPVINALGLIYHAMVGNENVLDEEGYTKYILWLESNFPYQEKIIKQYLAASDAQGFISSLKRKAETAINSGFNYNNEDEVWLAYLGISINGINISYGDFKARLDRIVRFDQEHPGYFNKLFTKTGGRPRVIELSSQGARVIDASSINSGVFMQNLDELLNVHQRIDSLSWMNEDFPGSKAFNLRNLYYLLKRQQAQEKGIITPGERFTCEFPSERAMEEELLADRKSLYKIAFSLANDRLSDAAISGKCLLLMRDLIISDIMLDDGLVNEMRSTNNERMITAFKNFYEDYKNHLPNSLGLSKVKIRGLQKHFEDFSAKVYAEISKVKTVKQSASSEGYRLVEQGFLSIFRGRAGMIDCSFDTGDKGDAYTRAMHEDTKYLFVYKGKELTGYIGLMVAQDKDKRNILTIDTINSPSLDGEELLGNLFITLNDLAGELGCIGIALPEKIAEPYASFNFANKYTISKMEVYKKAETIKVAPVHQESWGYFTKMFGEDQYNSIEKGSFVLLNLDTTPDKRSANEGAETSSPLITPEAPREVASSPNTLEDKEARIFLKNKGVDVDRLERDFGDIIQTYGYIDFKSLYIAAGKNAGRLFRSGLSKLKQIFTPEELKSYWPDLVRLGVASGYRVWHLFRHGIPALKKTFPDPEEFKFYWPDLVRLGVVARVNATFLFISSIRKLKKIFTPEEFKAYWPDLVRLGIAAGKNVWFLFQYAIPDLKKKILTPEEFKFYWPYLVRKGLAAGEGSYYLFSNTILDLKLSTPERLKSFLTNTENQRENAFLIQPSLHLDKEKAEGGADKKEGLSLLISSPMSINDGQNKLNPDESPKETLTQKDLEDAIAKFQPQKEEFVKEPILGFLVTSPYMQDVPVAILKYLGQMDQTYGGNLAEVLKTSVGGFIALQIKQNKQLDFYIVSPAVAQGKYTRDSIGPEGYERLIKAMKQGVVGMVRMSDIGFSKGRPIKIQVDWGTPDNPLPDEQVKSANKDAFLAFDGHQWYMLNVDMQDLPVNYVYAGENGKAYSELDRVMNNLIAEIAQKGNLDANSRNKLVMIAELAKQAHSKQERKQGGPYFVHPLAVARYALERFGVADMISQSVYLLHDTREDQKEFYEVIKGILDDMFERLERLSVSAESEQDRKEYNQIRLGVRLLTKPEVVEVRQGGGSRLWKITYKTENDEDVTNIFNSEQEAETAAELQYYDQILNAHKYFKKEISKGGPRYADYDDAFIRRMQQGKLSDRIMNIRDLINFFDPEVEQTDTVKDFPKKTFQKTLEIFIPYFVEMSDSQNPVGEEDKMIFYEDLIAALIRYAGLDEGSNPRVAPLKQAALKALRHPNLQKGLRSTGMSDQVNKYLTSATQSSPIPQKASSPLNRDLGGIDFRNLPIVTKSMDSLKSSIGAIPQDSLQRINLTQEWSDIEHLVNSGMTPSAERLKDYLVASCFKGDLDSDKEKIISCISDILRMQEESCCLTDPMLKDLIVVLGSGRTGEELKLAFAQTI